MLSLPLFTLAYVHPHGVARLAAPSMFFRSDPASSMFCRSDPSFAEFLPSSCNDLREPEALSALRSLQEVCVECPSASPSSVRTVFCEHEAASRPGTPDPPPPRVLLLHGADSSTLEWRFLMPQLRELGVSSTAVDWWSGGWTARGPILAQLDSERPTPWEPVREHLHAFWRAQLGGAPVVLVGASLGGAVALDFASAYPEAVQGLVLLDAGGESYKSPPPEVVTRFAPAALGVKKALAFVSARLPSEELRINALHRTAPLWSEALGAYLRSGGYAARVNRELIRTVAAPTLVVWGREDPILPLADAYAFERDLPACAGVREVAGCGHTPQLEKPGEVARHVAQFVREVARPPSGAPRAAGSSCS